MAHTHEDCPIWDCSDGMIFGPCGENCPTWDCMVVSHCTCKCHSNKDCGCGYHWDRMEKSA